ncbi:hypothetical protein GLOTRDRAFT_134251 [Gloeophyllum trabeum ATCC 11539]|uniref:F-box domain-containing protein n=1 Tax=Gloeophyllum trabeum (strain ATCC 11539 / FP-39264 / Madison 617) TaxID=670483 RepID=S7RCI5_GLOTA|nr:uncharacterized protein GLOTRDRAFT_134251 [Gloeophyllum trabeum ATCC 11539]EPQ50104.1 hypothetical protein GLOTRDRAFT_134251 [Gloeophyllum trabeum ATCC 11539]
MPPELIAQVADEFVTDLEATTSDPHTRQAGVVSLTHVCGRWRDQLVNNAKYWTSIFIETADSLRDLIDRSRRAPLSITGSLEKDHTGDLQKNNEDKLSLVMGVGSRLRSLSISVSSQVLGNVVGQAHGTMPILEHLEIKVTGAVGATNLTPFTSPVLRRLQLSGMDSLNDFRMLFTPALTELSIIDVRTAMTTLDIRQVLRGLPNLMVLKPLDVHQSTPAP